MAQDITNYTDEQKNAVFTAVCDELRTTTNSVTAICKKHNIALRTLYHWCKEEEIFGKMLEAAQDVRAWHYIEEAMQLIDNASPYYQDAKGNKHENNAALNKVRQQVTMRQYLAETLAPQTFGNLKYQIKEVEKDIRAMEKKVDELTKKNNFKN